MSMKKCPQCGELYADSYDTCPYCAEEEELYGTSGRKPPRRMAPGGRRVPVAVWIVLGILLAGALIWYLLGGKASDRKGGTQETLQETSVTAGPADTQRGEKEEKKPGGEPKKTDAEAPSVAQTLSLAIGEVRILTAAGAEGCVWSSSNPAVASVSESGELRAVSAGTAVITATAPDGQSASCTVTVTAANTAVPVGGTGGTTPEDGEEEEEEEFLYNDDDHIVVVFTTPTDLH